MRDVIDILTWEPNVKMQYELLLILLLFLMPVLHAKKRSALLKNWGLLFCLFAFLHRALLPLFVSGVYAYLLLGFLYALFRLRPGAFLEPAIRLWRLLQPEGKAPAFRRKRLDLSWKAEAPSISSVSAGCKAQDRTASALSDPDEIKARGVYFLLAILLTALLIQLCRINIGVDYDSLRYGLRSPYVLLGGEGLSGFLKNPGLVNTVYTYSKGFELLTLPLALFGELPFLESYAYVLCFNFWVLAGILFLSGAVASRLTGSWTAGVTAAFFCALTPGITNMALTAKSDLLTLLCQLIFVYALLAFSAGSIAPQAPAASKTGSGSVLDFAEAGWEGKRRDLCRRAAGILPRTSSADWVGIGLSALFASFALKPTSMVFSSVLGLCGLLFLLFFRHRSFGGADEKTLKKSPGKGGRGQEKPSAGRQKKLPFLLLPSPASLRLLLVSMVFVGVCWLRTFLITGMPVTSVFSGLFSALGFSLRYPFSLQAVPDSAAALSFTDSLRQLLTRLFGVLLFPAGEEMAHVRMAWGGLLFLLMFLLLLCCGRKTLFGLREAAEQNRIKREAALSDTDCTEATVSMFSCLLVLFYGITAVSLLSLYHLYQIDGNYYMLLYGLSASGGAAVLFWRGLLRGPKEGSVFASEPKAVSGNASGAERGVWASRLLEGFRRALFKDHAGLILLTALMLEVTAFTGWAGAVGFTEIPIRISGQGVKVGSFLPVSHREAANERFQKEGSYHLVRALSENPKGKAAHVIAFSDEPECYDIPCVTESYTDIVGSGGNVYLVKKLNIFKKYLSWSGTDYIYADKTWLSREGNERAKELLEDLIEDGTLCGITYEADAAEAETEEGTAEGSKEAIAGAAGGAASEGTDSEDAFLTGRRYFYGRIDPERAAQPWEVPLSSEKAAAAEEDMQKYEAE